MLLGEKIPQEDCVTVVRCAFMQAVGMVNDHLVGCFRHAPLARPSAGAGTRP
jgi:3-methyladenine DNA glycosylase Tag